MPTDASIGLTQPQPAPPGPLLAFWRSFRENRGAVLGLAFVAVIVFVAVFAPLLAPYDPFEQFRGSTKLPPFWVEGSDSRFILGTDAVGRDGGVGRVDDALGGEPGDGGADVGVDDRPITAGLRDEATIVVPAATGAANRAAATARAARTAMRTGDGRIGAVYDRPQPVAAVPAVRAHGCDAV